MAVRMEGSLKPASGTVNLFHLFALATQTVPRQGNQGNQAYLQIWIGFAGYQWYALPLSL